MQDGWLALAAELDRWAASGRTATFWWRDDDADSPSPALARLLDLTTGHGIVPLLAVVPEWAEPSLAGSLSETPVQAAQHGIAHRNNAAAGQSRTELVDGLPCLDDGLRKGRQRLAELLGDRLLPVLVPPWNRLGTGLRARLAGLGYAGLSTYRPRPAARCEGLVLVNCHCDPIDWRGGRGFLGEDAALAQLCEHLAARRAGTADAEEPTGILSHHAVHDGATWRFLEKLAGRLAAHPAACWTRPSAIFGLA